MTEEAMENVAFGDLLRWEITLIQSALSKIRKDRGLTNEET